MTQENPYAAKFKEHGIDVIDTDYKKDKLKNNFKYKKSDQ